MNRSTKFTNFNRHVTRILTRRFAVALIGYAVLASGCRREAATEAPVDSAVTQPDVSLNQQPPVHSVAAESILASSPAADGPTSTTVDETATPERVCQLLMERLQRGDRIAAESLLSRTSLNIITQANLKLEPISGSESKIRVLPARYETYQHQVAEVDCLVADVVANQAIESESTITWQVQRQSGSWRVTGMRIPLDNGQTNRLLSFESIDDVATIKLLATGEAISGENTARQAEASAGQTTLQ